jgi:hypothetical protein
VLAELTTQPARARGEFPARMVNGDSTDQIRASERSCAASPIAKTAGLTSELRFSEKVGR